MSVKTKNMTEIDIDMLNNDIAQFPQVYPITEDMKLTHEGVSRLVMLDRYAFKDTEKKTLKKGDFVVLTVKQDPKFPARGYGFVQSVDRVNNEAEIVVAEEFRSVLENEREAETGLIKRDLDVIDKPLEIYYEQIAKRNATGLAAVEETAEKREQSFHAFSEQLAALNFIPAGRVLYGAGSDTEVTYFNCYVMPFVRDSRGGISEH